MRGLIFSCIAVSRVKKIPHAALSASFIKSSRLISLELPYKILSTLFCAAALLMPRVTNAASASFRVVF